MAVPVLRTTLPLLPPAFFPVLMLTVPLGRRKLEPDRTDTSPLPIKPLAPLWIRTVPVAPKVEEPLESTACPLPRPLEEAVAAVVRLIAPLRPEMPDPVIRATNPPEDDMFMLDEEPPEIMTPPPLLELLDPLERDNWPAMPPSEEPAATKTLPADPATAKPVRKNRSPLLPY